MQLNYYNNNDHYNNKAVLYLIIVQLHVFQFDI